MSDTNEKSDYSRGNSRFKGGQNREGDRFDGRRDRNFSRKKVCRICTGQVKATYRSPDSLRRFVTERGKILPRRITGTCAKHQRFLSTEIKRARVLALLPFISQ